MFLWMTKAFARNVSVMFLSLHGRELECKVMVWLANLAIGHLENDYFYSREIQQDMY